MLTLRGHTNTVQTLAYSPDGHTLASASDDRTVRLWDLATGQTRVILDDHSEPMLALAFSPDSSDLAYGGFDKQVHLCDTARGGTIVPFEPFPRFEHAITGIAFSPNGQHLAVGADLIRTRWANPRARRALLPAPTLRVRDMLTGQDWVPSFEDGPQAVWCLAFSPDGATLAAGLGNGAVVLWDFASRTEQRRLTHDAGIHAIVFSPKNTTLAALAGRQVKLWRSGQRSPVSMSMAHAGYAWSVAFTRDGHFLATGGWDGTVRLWDPHTGQERAKYDWGLGRVNAVAFAPDGMTAAAAGTSPEIIIWDVDDLSW